MFRFLIIFFCLLVPTIAQPTQVETKLRAAAATKYQVGGEWQDGKSNVVWYTVVPYQKIYFACLSGSDHYGMDFYSVWEYLDDGKWHFIFEHRVSDAGPEVEAQLDKLYAKHRISSGMRKQLMHGPEKKF